MVITDLDEQFTFYASYHQDRWNKLIHIIFLWPILWSALVLLQYVPIEHSPPFLSAITSLHPINLSLIAAIVYGGTYILMDKRAGTLGAILIFVCLFTGRKFYLESLTCTGYPAWEIALFVQIPGWALQLVGHGVFEKRVPAPLDSLVELFVMAPLFLLLEVMFAFGYRKDFQVKMYKKVEQEIAKFKATVKKQNE